ncbi:DUF2079 domain-containing protein [Fluviicola sp.]|uniref:DUF2079 domain-containing protein n=1 Tax=Fluviicola sp. TaxID=1917219 RepID=UPI00261BFD90|nr:DUF2079 domain-containing protein [Fluviicola sp.]
MSSIKNFYLGFKQVPEKYLVVLAFAVIYSLISFVNHYLFRTYALDLGLYSNALYDYAHFQWNDSTTFKVAPENLLGDHFDFYLILFSPLVWIFGSYTLPIIQIAALLFGGLGVYRYFKTSRYMAAMAMIFFYSFFGVLSALSYDFHDSVVVASLVPWLFVFTKERKLKWCVFFLIVLCVGKENSPLWVAFICFGLSLQLWNEKKWRNFYILAGVFSMIYFMIVIKLIMPALAGDGVYPHFDYSILGGSMGSAVKHLLFHPIDSFNLMISNFNGDPMADDTKAFLLRYLIYSGIILLLFRPAYLVMLIPIFFQKLFHDSPIIWGAGFHYCIEFTPILAIGVFEVIGKLKKESFRKIGATVVVLSAMIITHERMTETYFYTPDTNINFLSKNHYKKEYNVKPVYAAFKLIPGNAIVSAQSNLVPHLANRNYCYMYPVVKNAEYVVLAKKDTSYPLTDSIFQVEIKKYQESPDWIKLVDQEEVLLVKKRK